MYHIHSYTSAYFWWGVHDDPERLVWHGDSLCFIGDEDAFVLHGPRPPHVYREFSFDGQDVPDSVHDDVPWIPPWQILSPITDRVFQDVYGDFYTAQWFHWDDAVIWTPCYLFPAGSPDVPLSPSETMTVSPTPALPDDSDCDDVLALF